MTDFFVAIGLVLVLEGLMFAGFPAFVRARMRETLELDEGMMRVIGLISTTFGMLIVFLVRHYVIGA
jgi:uncharacterized protein YjeT (DUF2065 family)